MTTSLYLHFPPAKCLRSVRNPNISLRNPSYFTSLPLLSHSRFSSSSWLQCHCHVDEKDWEKWMRHFDQNDQQAKLVSHLKSQYTCAVDREDYETAARLQEAITKATKDDAVGRVMSDWNKAVEEERYEDATFLRDHTGAGLVGWWAGVSDDQKYPYGQIIHITAEHGRFLARSYSPWQLATAKNGTPLFEIYVSHYKEGNCEEQAIYLMHKAASEDSLKMEDMKIDVRLSHLTPYPSQDLWAETLWRFSVASGRNNTKEEFKDMFVKCGMGMKIEGDEETELAKLSSEEKTVIRHVFSVGGNVKKATEKLDNDFLRLPATLERKACFSFSLSVDINNTSVDENNDQEIYAEHSLKDHRTAILDLVDCIGRGVFKEDESHDKLWPFVLSQAQNQQPLLSGLTTFNRIEVTASSDPLKGLYIGSNGFLVTEVIQLRRKFGHWHEDGGIDDVSELEPCEYVEVVKLTGDPDVPAGQVARYKGQGRLTGFQKSEWVDVELFILEGEYRKDGFAIGFLYSAPDYYYLKLFKQLRLPSS